MNGGWRSCWPNKRRKPRPEDEAALRRFLEQTGINVVSNEEAEEVDAVICNTADLWSPFRDNTPAICADCGAAIYHRPHVPKKPKKICVNCALVMHEKEKAGDL